MADKSLDKLEIKIEKLETLADKISMICQQSRDLIEKHKQYDDGFDDDFDDDVDEYEDDIDEEEDK